MRLAPLLLALTLTSGSAYAVVPHGIHESYPDAASLDTPFTLTSDTQIPGATLKPGRYSMIIKDHLTDRVIVQVSRDNGKVIATFLGALHSGLQGAGSPGPIRLNVEKGHEALKGFTFPSGGTVEFVYPKAEAAALVDKTSEAVLAIDPPSDNLHSKDGVLSREDSQIVTLWSLQATRLSASQKGIAAKKFAPQQPSETPVIARAEAPAPVSTPVPARVFKRPAPAPKAQVAANHIPVAKALPRTASNMPLLLLSALSSLTIAFGLRVRGQSLNER